MVAVVPLRAKFLWENQACFPSLAGNNFSIGFLVKSLPYTSLIPMRGTVWFILEQNISVCIQLHKEIVTFKQCDLCWCNNPNSRSFSHINLTNHSNKTNWIVGLFASAGTTGLQAASNENQIFDLISMSIMGFLMDYNTHHNWNKHATLPLKIYADNPPMIVCKKNILTDLLCGKPIEPIQMTCWLGLNVVETNLPF